MSATTEHTCGTIRAPQSSEPGTAQTAPALTPLTRSDVMPDDTPPVPRRLRFEVLRRDGYACQYCGATAPDAELHVDHVVPRVLGGTSDPTNLVTACKDCNAGKTSTAPDQAIVAAAASQAEAWAAALERATEIERNSHVVALDPEVAARFLDAWDGYGPLRASDLPYGWERSVTTFDQRGLNFMDRLDAIDITSGKNTPDPFRYFCGVCWGIIRTRIEIAERLIQDGN